MPGPPRKPTEILRLTGSWRANERKNEPKPAQGCPDAPAGLSEAERGIWDRLAATLDGMGVGTVADWPVLLRFCKQWVRWEACEAVIATSGLTYESHGRNGTQIKLRPEAVEAARLDQSLRALEQQLGLTPAARAKLSIVPERNGIVNKVEILREQAAKKPHGGEENRA